MIMFFAGVIATVLIEAALAAWLVHHLFKKITR